MGKELEEIALDYSRALHRFNYSTYREGEWREAERSKGVLDEEAVDSLLRAKEEKFLTLLREETDPNQLKQIAYRNMSALELRSVLVPVLERYAELCGPNLLLFLLLSSLYWNYGEDEAAERYLDMAAELDSDNVNLLHHRLLYTNDPDALASICRRILERYPGDAVATETMQRIEKGLTPYSPRAGEHAAIDFVLQNLNCTG